MSEIPETYVFFDGRYIGHRVHTAKGQRIVPEVSELELVDMIHELPPHTQIHLKENAPELAEALRTYGRTPEDILTNATLGLYITELHVPHRTALRKRDWKAYELMRKRNLTHELFYERSEDVESRANDDSM